MNSSLTSVTYLARFFGEDFLLKTYMMIDLLQGLIAENPSDDYLKGMLRDLLDTLNPENYILQTSSCEDDKLIYQIHHARLNIREIARNNCDTTEATITLNRLYDILYERLMRRYSDQLDLSQNSNNPIQSYTERLADVVLMIKENRQALRD